MADSSGIIKNKGIVLLSAVLVGVVGLLWYGVQKQPYVPEEAAAGRDLTLAALKPASKASDAHLSQALLQASANGDPAIPRFDIVRLSRGGSGVVAGRAMPGDQVSIMVNERQVASGIADLRGQWVMILEQPLPEGSNLMGLVALNKQGVRRQSEDLVAVSIPQAGEAGAPRTALDDVVAVLTPRDGGKSRILQRPLPLAGVHSAVSIDTIDVMPSDDAIYSGSAEAGRKVRISIDGKFLREVVADKNSRWSVRVPLAALDNPRDFIIHADQLAQDGRIDVRVEQQVGLVKNSAAAPGDGPDLLIEPQDNLWAMTRWAQDSAAYYSYVFDAGANRISNPDLSLSGPGFKFPRERSEY